MRPLQHIPSPIIITAKNIIEDAYLIFHLKLRASNLLVAPYTEYQQFLYETISKYLEEGWNYQQIADWLIDNGYKTPRGKRFFNTHVFSILKKKRLRDERLDGLPEDRFEITSPLRIEYLDRKLINSR